MAKNQGDITYSPSIMGAVRQMLGAEDENDTKYDSKIQILSKSEIFDLVLKWEGYINCDYEIKKWVEEIWHVELK
jgi:hypothetical protein